MLLLVDYLHLLADALFVNVLEDVLDALRVDAEQRTLGTPLVEYLAVAACLHDGHAALLHGFLDSESVHDVLIGFGDAAKIVLFPYTCTI